MVTGLRVRNHSRLKTKATVARGTQSAVAFVENYLVKVSVRRPVRIVERMERRPARLIPMVSIVG